MNLQSLTTMVINYVYIRMVYNAWNILGVVSIILLFWYRKNKNAVWGGLTLGIIIGLVIAVALLIKGDGFSWLILIRSGIVGSLIGFIMEFIGIAAGKLSKK